MKHRSKALLFLGLATFPGTGLFAQQSDTQSLAAFKGDTARYIEVNFINRKEKYVNQPLRTLLYDLGIPIQSYIYGVNFQDKAKTPGIDIYFTDAAAYHMSRFPKKTGAMKISVSFQTPVATSDVRNLYKQSGGAWLPQEEKFYGDQAVVDFQFVKAFPIK